MLFCYPSPHGGFEECLYTPQAEIRYLLKRTARRGRNFPTKAAGLITSHARNAPINDKNKTPADIRTERFKSDRRFTRIPPKHTFRLICGGSRQNYVCPLPLFRISRHDEVCPLVDVVHQNVADVQRQIGVRGIDDLHDAEDLRLAHGRARFDGNHFP